MPHQFPSLPSPCFVADMAAINANLAKASWLKQQTSCQILLATKACSMFSLFPHFATQLDGTTASGLYEARLGHEEFGGEVHAYSPAYSPGEVEALLPIVSHLYFNSIAQLNLHAHHLSQTPVKCGLRLNPELSLVKNSALYDPSASGSRFGVKAHEITPEILDNIDVLHVHNLCENMADDSVTLIEHLINTVPHLLKSVEALNLGGGHYITHEEYDLPKLAHAINRLQNMFNLQVILEPGGALSYNAGYLITTVLDVIERADNVENSPHIAILDSSATCHMPDTLEVPYTPRVTGATETKTATDTQPTNRPITTLSGKTCLTGDTIGHYHFDTPLIRGDRVLFEDMLQYTMVKTTTFNGLPLPAIAILHEDGTTEIIKEFSYEDFKNRLS